ncbi:harbinger transposase-derived protein [Artemisia annua]|uniref:Harbinger transposase-derived protein n=1 Tax=Artemisia annua TaxID=35608 RepID=A0A2U1QM88_ARTAN|nr:harbinger transposase-derived protein [Artemisia annua]
MSSSSTPSSIISSSFDDRKFVISKTIKQAVLFIKIRFKLQLAGCSIPRKISRNPPEKRDRYGAHDRLVAAYLSENLVYDEQVFRRRFRMSRRLFLRIVHDIKSRSRYFQQMQDAGGKLGFSALQKCTSEIRQRALGSIPNA